MKAYRHIIALGVPLAVAVILFFWALQTPEYSIYQMFKAADAHNYQTFRKYVDVEDVARGTMETVYKQTTKDMNRRFKRGSQTEQRFLEIYLTQNKPILKEDVKYALKRQVETDILYPEYHPQNIFRAIRDIHVTVSGHSANALLLPTKTDAALPPLKVRLRSIGWHWQIFEMQQQTIDEQKTENKKTL